MTGERTPAEPEVDLPTTATNYTAMGLAAGAGIAIVVGTLVGGGAVAIGITIGAAAGAAIGAALDSSAARPN